MRKARYVYMVQVKFPALINTQQMIKPRLEVYYPKVSGLQNQYIQQIINHVLLKQVNQLLIDQGYYQNPMAQVSGWYELKTNQRGILSLSIGNYTFAGGAHGMTIVKSLTADTSTGRFYSLGELFKPDSNYVQILSTIIKAQIVKRDIQLLAPFQEIQPNQDYYISDKVLVVYFQLYEITPYVFGFPQFPISVYEIQDIIKENSPLGKMLGDFF